MPHVASSVERVPHSRIRELAEIAMSMQGVLRLYFGESNLPTPDFIKRAAMDALADGYTFYTENAGCRRCAAPSPGSMANCIAWSWTLARRSWSRRRVCKP
jgi:aspartate/methionine/tyrosine aminotransferase